MVRLFDYLVHCGSPDGSMHGELELSCARHTCPEEPTVSDQYGSDRQCWLFAFPQVVHCNMAATHGQDVAVFFLTCGGVTIPPDNTILMAMGTGRSVS